MYYRDYNAERDRKFFKMYKTNAIKKHDLDIYTEPENYIECAI